MPTFIFKTMLALSISVKSKTDQRASRAVSHRHLAEATWSVEPWVFVIVFGVSGILVLTLVSFAACLLCRKRVDQNLGYRSSQSTIVSNENSRNSFDCYIRKLTRRKSFGSEATTITSEEYISNKDVLVDEFVSKPALIKEESRISILTIDENDLHVQSEVPYDTVTDNEVDESASVEEYANRIILKYLTSHARKSYEF